MRFIKLRTIHRRGGTSFMLKDLRRNPIGTMQLPPGGVHHELELSEPDYLRHAKALAELCALPEAAVYVVAVRDDAAEAAAVFKTAVVLSPDVSNQTPFKKLVKIAADEGCDISGCATNQERATAIQLHRENLAAA